MSQIGPADPLAALRLNLSKDIPIALVDELLLAYKRIKENFYLGKHGPSELNAAMACEAVARIIQYKSTGKYIPLGKHIPRIIEVFRGFESATNLDDSFRYHIPRVAIAVYDIRNKRGVGHLGGDVNPNLADSVFLAGSVDWILAEFVRHYYQCSLDDAQKIVDGLVQRKFVLVYTINDKMRVMNPSLNYSQATLLLLASQFPAPIDDKTLREWTEHSNLAVYKRDILRKLHSSRLIEYDGIKCTILPTGLKYVEDNYSQWSSFTPGVSPPKKRRKTRGSTQSATSP